VNGKFRIYNSLNQLWRVYNGTNTSLLLEEFTYDPVEERVLIKKSYNTTGTLIETVVYVDQSFVQIKNLTGVFNYTYIYHEGQLVAQINPDGTKYYIHSDSKGSNTVITNSSAKIIENSSYAPFGEILSSGNKSRYGYEGKEFDSQVGDIDFNARKYNPSTGLFLSPDSQIKNFYDPQSLNRFMFERANPYRNTDPTGHITWGDVGQGAAIISLLFLAGAVAWFLTPKTSNPNDAETMDINELSGNGHGMDDATGLSSTSEYGQGLEDSANIAQDKTMKSDAESYLESGTIVASNGQKITIRQYVPGDTTKLPKGQSNNNLLTNYKLPENKPSNTMNALSYTPPKPKTTNTVDDSIQHYFSDMAHTLNTAHGCTSTWNGKGFDYKC